MVKIPPKQAQLVRALRRPSAPKPKQILPQTPTPRLPVQAVLAENGEK